MESAANLIKKRLVTSKDYLIEFLKAIIDYQSRNRRFGGIESLSNGSFKDSYYSS